MIGLLNRIFKAKHKTKAIFQYSTDEMGKLVRKNRESLGLVNNWIDTLAFKRSCFNYGVPDYIKDDINKPINESITYTDLIQYISKKHFQKINYLEIGVSVGKNFFQLLSAHHNSRFTGFDIEEINPVIESFLTFRQKEEWVTPDSSIKKTPSSLKKFVFDGMEVEYLCADIWDTNSWSKLEGNKFNIVFSDALHSHKAILFEFEMLVKYGLLAERFIIVWDDLEGKMKNAFYKIIRKYDKKYQIADIYLLNINGWIGEHERPHTVGIISNFPL